MGCFVGCKANSTSLWVVEDRFRQQWRTAGGRVLRVADPAVDGTTHTMIPLRMARSLLAARAAPVPEAEVVQISDAVPRKRGRPRKDGA